MAYRRPIESEGSQEITLYDYGHACYVSSVYVHNVNLEHLTINVVHG